MPKGQDVFRKIMNMMPSNEEKLHIDKAKVEELESKVLEDVQRKDKYLGRKRRYSKQSDCPADAMKKEECPIKKEEAPKRKPRTRKSED